MGHPVCHEITEFRLRYVPEIPDTEQNLLKSLYQHPKNCQRPNTLMGEGFILLTRGYGFMGGGVPPPF